MKKGWTLIEILVVIGILGVIAIIATNLFFSILRGSTKTRVLTEVKQNGNYAINVMERMIRNAEKDSLRYDAGEGKWIEIKNPDGGTTLFTCPDSNNMIASNGASLTSNKVRVEDCTSTFTVAPGVEDVRPPAVTIDFTLMQAGTTTRPEEQASVNFKTTVILRNY